MVNNKGTVYKVKKKSLNKLIFEMINKQRLILFFLIVLIIPQFVKGNLTFNFSSTDVDSDEIYGYLIFARTYNTTSGIISVEEINNYTTKLLDNGALERTFYVNKDLGEGFYKYDILVNDSKISNEYIIQNINYSQLKYAYVNPSPEVYIINEFYINGWNTDLKQIITYKNPSNTNFYKYPLYDVFSSTRSCINEEYYNSKAEKLKIEKSSIDKEILNVTLPANGEASFIVKCKILNNIKLTEDKNRKFEFQSVYQYHNQSEINIRQFTKKIYFPEEDKFLKKIIFVNAQPNENPQRIGNDDVFEYIDNYDSTKKNVTSHIVITYNYEYQIMIAHVIFNMVVFVVGIFVGVLLQDWFKRKLKNIKNRFMKKPKNNC
jgi:hypothetical protein